jgi:hypothetical protein
MARSGEETQRRVFLALFLWRDFAEAPLQNVGMRHLDY